jgi:NhaP-type Na+/H+ or K+/H+ antiporter
MSASIIITIGALLLLAYIFDITSSRTRVPSIILLLIMGSLVRHATTWLKISVPDLEPVLPVLGTIGLILIVLEGSLELELKKSNFTLIRKSTIVALLPMLLLSFGLGYAVYYFDPLISFKDSLSNVIPIAVISSAVAISSAKNLGKFQKEFITYESSLSDVFGVIFFNFVTLHTVIDQYTVGSFFLDIIFILIVSFVTTLGLAYLLSRTQNQVKFLPIIILIIMIYFISKEFHLPALVFIVIFGLSIGNINELRQYKFVQKLHTRILNIEIRKFKILTIELTFLIRALFFILFGFLIKMQELLNTKTILWAIATTFVIFIVRAIILLVMKLPLKSLLFISPRGLITVLLFLSIPNEQSSVLVNNSIIIQVIILTVLVMMVGLLFSGKEEIKD